MSVQVKGTVVIDDSINVSNLGNVAVNGFISVGGTSGTAGQFLTSNASGNVYWSTVAAGVPFSAFGTTY